jgi:hypothetical protein
MGAIDGDLGPARGFEDDQSGGIIIHVFGSPTSDPQWQKKRINQRGLLRK